jgi:hypothetical protein
MTDQEFVTQVQEAKKAGDSKKLREILAEYLRPEAKTVVEEAQKPINQMRYKDGYGVVLTFCAGLPSPYRQAFIDACVKEGFPLDTAATVRELV